MDNKFHVENWDTLTDEQKESTNKLLEQHTNYLKKQFEKEQSEKMEQVKKETEQELTEKQKAQLERENALKEVPEKSRSFVNKLLDKGFTLDEIKQDQPELLEPEKPVADNKVFSEAIIEPHTGISVSPSGKADADLDAKIKLWKKNGMPENATDADWEQWFEAHRKGLI